MYFWQWIWGSQSDEEKAESSSRARAVIDELRQVQQERGLAARAETQTRAQQRQLQDQLTNFLAQVAEAGSIPERKVITTELFHVLCGSEGRTFVRQHDRFASTVFAKMYELCAQGLRLDREHAMLFPTAAREYPLQPVGDTVEDPEWEPRFLEF